MTWALKRQLYYIIVLVLFFGIFGFLIIYPSFNKAPSCMDRVQNGTESGVDCGGSCLLACISESDAVSIIWARSFLVVPGRYNAVAYLENNNKNLAVNKINYSFRFADKDNIYLGRREGTAFVPPGRPFAIFERGIEFNNSSPVYTTFEFTGVPVWINVDENKINQLKIFASGIRLENEDTSPHLSAVIKNDSLFTVPNISVVAVLYDEDGNAISASSTYLDELRGEEEKSIDFTWPMPFLGKVFSTEILPAYNIFTVKLE